VPGPELLTMTLSPVSSFVTWSLMAPVMRSVFCFVPRPTHGTVPACP
jgi:hypothetical protein